MSIYATGTGLPEPAVDDGKVMRRSDPPLVTALSRLSSGGSHQLLGRGSWIRRPFDTDHRDGAGRVACLLAPIGIRRSAACQRASWGPPQTASGMAAKREKPAVAQCRAGQEGAADATC